MKTLLNKQKEFLINFLLPVGIAFPSYLILSLIWGNINIGFWFALGIYFGQLFIILLGEWFSRGESCNTIDISGGFKGTAQFKKIPINQGKVYGECKDDLTTN